MPRLLDDIRAVLDGAGFETSLPRPDSLTLHFEDVSVIGHVHVLDSGEEIAATWQAIQDEFLRQNSSRFMKDITKAWNIYTIVVTSSLPTPDVAAALFAIEEDFRGTRKIARAGIVTREDVVVALAPVLPLQNVLAVGLVDAKQRLVERLEAVSPALRQLATESTPEAIVASLLVTE